MKTKLLLTLIFAAGLCLAQFSPGPPEIIYTNPKANSRYISVKSSIIIAVRPDLQNSLHGKPITISVAGEKSGEHQGKVIVSGNAVIFEPFRSFEPDEQITVIAKSPLFSAAGIYMFPFHTSEFSEYNQEIFRSVSDDAKILTAGNQSVEVYGKPTDINGVTVPGDFPKFNVSLSGQTAPGKIFISNWGGTSYMIIFENDGTPYFYKRFPGSNQTRDFKVQPTGTLTRRVYENMQCFVEMDSQYTNIDTFRCKNGYGTDEHDIQLSADGRSLLIALDYRTVNMSQLVPGGQTNATVIGNHVQELDANHNVVFEWKSWDNFIITDAVHENLTANTIDYVHMNSVAYDYDGNIIISSRHLSEVTKINRTTGAIMWRLGGVRNQFNYINDTYGISYQHDARPVPGKPNHYTIFDNGNYHSPSFSRVVEFKIDPVAMTAQKVWEYRRSPDYYTSWMGNAQRLPNGNTFIDWADNSLPKAYEVTESGQNVYSAKFEQNTPVYRAFRFDWKSVLKVPYLVLENYQDRVTLIFNKFGDTTVQRYIIYAGLTPNPVTRVDSTMNTKIDLTEFASTNQRYYFRVTARHIDGSESGFSNEENAVVTITLPGQNMLTNGDFSAGSTGWYFNARNGAQALGEVVNGEYRVTITNSGSVYSDIQLIQESFPMIQGKNYIFEFDARAASTRIIEPRVAQNGGNFTVYSRTGPMVITSQMQHYRFPFQMTDPTDFFARVVMNTGTSTVTTYFDNISVKEDVPAGTGEGQSAGPGEYILFANYPNPFNPETQIRYYLPEQSQVHIEVFTVMGEKVATLIENIQNEGAQELSFNGKNLPSGIYYLRASFKSLFSKKNNISINKMLLVK